MYDAESQTYSLSKKSFQNTFKDWPTVNNVNDKWKWKKNSKLNSIYLYPTQYKYLITMNFTNSCKKQILLGLCLNSKAKGKPHINSISQSYFFFLGDTFTYFTNQHEHDTFSYIRVISIYMSNVVWGRGGVVRYNIAHI